MNKKIFVFLLLTSILFLPVLGVSARTKGVPKFVKQTTGIISGVTVGPMIGGFRGWLKGFRMGTLYIAEILGNRNGSLERTIGFGTGGFVGAIGGGYSGFLMGAYNGIIYGIDKPLSKENYSLTGKSITDYPLL